MRTFCRRDIYTLFRNMGYNTPEHGTVSELAPKLISREGEHALLVVYLNEMACSGQDMELMEAQKALHNYPEHYCSEYIACGIPGKALRLLQVGSRRWLIQYKNDSDWKATSGLCSASIQTEQEPKYVPEIPLPCWAIDFVQTTRQGLIAVDFTPDPPLDVLDNVLPENGREDLRKRATKFFASSSQS